MRIRQIWVKNFRGIKELDWQPSPGLNCLIGSGDGGKTTVLDAIELLLSERYNVTFDDLDFYGGSTEEPVLIAATFTDLPIAFKRDDKYGLALSGWGPTGVVEEPSETRGVEAALTFRLDVDATLEPRWSIHFQRSGSVEPPKPIAFQDRKVFAPARLGTYSDRHLSWGRNSSLQRVSAHPEKLPATLNELARNARTSFTKEAAGAFAEVITSIKPDMERLGVRLRNGLAASLDHASLSLGASGVALHDGDIPLRCAGTGTARLAVAALQSTEAAERKFLLVDELEFGLEPHRISLLVNHLRSRTASTGQAFITTHSLAVLREARFGEVHVCRRSKNGKLTITGANEIGMPALESKRYVRDKGEAFLARSVLVCEGQTEVALLKGFSSASALDFQSLGVVFVDAGGDPACFSLALHFAKMGYRTAVLTDSDKTMDPVNTKALTSAGVPHFAWGQGKCTEAELFTGLPTPFRRQLLELIAAEVEPKRLLGEFSAAVGARVSTLQEAIGHLENDDLCARVGTQANHCKWMKKDFDLCHSIGERILAMVSLVESGGSCFTHLERLREWMTADA